MSDLARRRADLPATPKLGVVVNPNSGRNRSGTQALDALLARQPQIAVERPASPDRTAASLAAPAAHHHRQHRARG